MKILKELIGIGSICLIILTNHCYANTLLETKISDDQSTCYKKYQISEDEKETFFNTMPQELQIGNSKYQYNNYKIMGGNIVDTININTTKSIISNTNNKNEIIRQLGEVLNYNENGYVGEYKIDIDSLNIKTNYNGYKEELIEKNISYNNLEKNDLSYIPKEINDNNLKLDLINVEWQIESTKKIGDNEVPNTYKANCYYATKQKIDYPYTYTITVQYNGTASKIEKHPLNVEVEYKKIEEKTNSITNTPEKNKNLTLPTTVGTGIIIIIILIYYSKNVTVYNLKNGKWKKVGKTRVNKKQEIKLSKFSIFENSNQYKLKLNRQISNKLKGKLITIYKNKSNVKSIVNPTKDGQCIIEVMI